MGIEYRYELKYLISSQDAYLLKNQLSKIMKKDPHSVNDSYSYLIRSLYFDDPYHSAYLDKTEGNQIRHKYRIRKYNLNDDVISLECKHKDDNMTYKESCRISKETCEALIDGSYRCKDDDPVLLKRFLAECSGQMLKADVIVDYKRLALVYPVSEVRITFDEEIRSGDPGGFFKNDLPTVPVFPEGHCVLEVKCNEFIPVHILNVIAQVPKIRQAVSKFASCRGIRF